MKKFKVVFAPEALLDVKEGIDWYNLQQKNLGARFIEEINLLLIRSLQTPYCFCKI